MGRRKRKVINPEGEKGTLIIRRLRCKGCGRTHSELPDIVMPYKRHCAETYEKVIGGDTGDVCCEESTTRRILAWWAACLLYFESVLASLREKYGVVLSGKSAPREIVRAVVNSHLWVSTRSVFLSG
jgi:hypothetical protein